MPMQGSKMQKDHQTDWFDPSNTVYKILTLYFEKFSKDIFVGEKANNFLSYQCRLLAI